MKKLYFKVLSIAYLLSISATLYLSQPKKDLLPLVMKADTLKDINLDLNCLKDITESFKRTHASVPNNRFPEDFTALRIKHTHDQQWHILLFSKDHGPNPLGKLIYSLHNDHTHIDILYVCECSRKHGYGASLLRYVLKNCLDEKSYARLQAYPFEVTSDPQKSSSEKQQALCKLISFYVKMGGNIENQYDDYALITFNPLKTA